MQNNNETSPIHPAHRMIAEHNRTRMNATFLVGMQNAQNAQDCVNFFAPRQQKK